MPPPQSKAPTSPVKALVAAVAVLIGTVLGLVAGIASHTSGTGDPIVTAITTFVLATSMVLCVAIYMTTGTG
jgi:hypothetical protein